MRCARPVERSSEDEPDIVRTTQAGYVRHIALCDLAEEEATFVRLPAPWEHSSPRKTFSWKCGRAPPRSTPSAPSDATLRSDRSATRSRTLYGVHQLAEIAKALSPGVKDPATAESVIGYLRAVLERLAQRPPSPEVSRGNVRLAYLRRLHRGLSSRWEVTPPPTRT